MSDIAVPSAAPYGLAPDQKPATGVDLELWARKAQSAAVYAEAVCNTKMAPAAYQGKPAEATAAILAGAELGFSPMASLRAFDSIQGVPAPKAMTLRAVVQAAGHEVVIAESTNDRAVVRGRRKGSTEWQESVWDVARAEQMPQYKSNPNYRTNRAAMLVARATAEVCRWVGADAVMGMPYAAEEIGDQQPVAAAPVTRRLTVAELEGGPDAVMTTGPELVGSDQHRHMHALWRELGYDGEDNRDNRLAITAKILGLPELESSAGLTRDQADEVIAALVERKARTGASDA